MPTWTPRGPPSACQPNRHRNSIRFRAGVLGLPDGREVPDTVWAKRGRKTGKVSASKHVGDFVSFRFGVTVAGITMRDPGHKEFRAVNVC
jgi:hypothetical protein